MAQLHWEQTGRSALRWLKEGAGPHCWCPLTTVLQQLPAVQTGPVSGTAAFLATLLSIIPTGSAYGCSLRVCCWHPALPLASGTPSQ